MRDRKQLILPMDFGVMIAQDSPVRKLAEICEKLDYTKLLNTYKRVFRRVDPIIMFELVLFGYMNGRYSSREIEESCRNDIRCMWILQGNPVPDHSRIARFQNEKLAPIIEGLFYQYVEQLIELGEVGYQNVFVDGTKIEANANKYSFVWTKSVKRHFRNLNIKIEAQLPQIAQRYGLETSIEIEEYLEYIKKLAIERKIQFVRGAGSIRSQLQRDIEMLSEFFERKKKYLDYTETFKCSHYSTGIMTAI